MWDNREFAKCHHYRSGLFYTLKARRLQHLTSTSRYVMKNKDHTLDHHRNTMQHFYQLLRLYSKVWWWTLVMMTLKRYIHILNACYAVHVRAAWRKKRVNQYLLCSDYHSRYCSEHYDRVWMMSLQWILCREMDEERVGRLLRSRTIQRYMTHNHAVLKIMAKEVPGSGDLLFRGEIKLE